MTIAIVDPQAIAAGARDKVTAEQLAVLRASAGGLSTSNHFESIAARSLYGMGLVVTTTLGGAAYTVTATEAGRCLLQMLAAVEPAPPPSEPEPYWTYDRSPYGTGGDDFATKEEAIAAGRADLEGEAFWVMRVRPIKPAEMVPSAERMFDYVHEHICENHASEDEQTPAWDDAKAAETELGVLLRAWATRHMTRSRWLTVEDEERIEPVAAIGRERIGGA